MASEFVRPPMSHPYDYFQMRQAILLREAEQERLAREAAGESRGEFEHGWARWLGLRMISRGEQLAHVQHIRSASEHTV
jgi:hypothetical protein